LEEIKKLNALVLPRIGGDKKPKCTSLRIPHWLLEQKDCDEELAKSWEEEHIQGIMTKLRCTVAFYRSQAQKRKGEFQW
jgi:hypothetical protein